MLQDLAEVSQARLPNREKSNTLPTPGKKSVEDELGCKQCRSRDTAAKPEAKKEERREKGEH
jgi:hypothetical protein